MSETEYSDDSSEAHRLWQANQQAAYEAYMRLWTPAANAYYDAYHQREHTYDLDAAKERIHSLQGTAFHTLLTTALTQELARAPGHTLSASQIDDIVRGLIKQHTAEADENLTQAAHVAYKQLTGGVFHPTATDLVSVADFLGPTEMLATLRTKEEIITRGVLNKEEEEVPLLDTDLTQYTFINAGKVMGGLPILQTLNLQARRNTSHIAPALYTYGELARGNSLIPLPPQAAEFTRRGGFPIQALIDSIHETQPPHIAEILIADGKPPQAATLPAISVRLAVGKHMNPASFVSR